jgi:hypothetical protein
MFSFPPASDRMRADALGKSDERRWFHNRSLASNNIGQNVCCDQRVL